MENAIMEKKVWYLGTWRDDSIGDNIIRSVAIQVKSDKGYKVRLQLSRDGMRVVKSNVIQGKVMTDYLSLGNIHFVTVNQYNPNCLLFIGNDTSKKYKLVAFRCANAVDAGLFVGCFKDLRKSVKVGEGYHVESKKHDGINWTLRSKNAANDKRQLSTFVDVSGGTAVVHQNGYMNGNGIENENHQVKQKVDSAIQMTQSVSQSRASTSPRERVTREELYMEGKLQHNIGVQAAGYGGDGIPDNMSVSSDSSALRDELDYLSHELREIKFMLEKSTGISAEEYQQKRGNVEVSRSYDPDVNKKYEVTVSRKYEPVSPTESEVKMALEPIDAVVMEENGDSPGENGNVVLRPVKGRNPATMGDAVHASVPDYRSLGVQTAPKDIYIKRKDKPQDHSGPEILRAKPMSYNSWKDEVVMRGKVTSRQMRPRTGYGSTSSYSSTTSGSYHGSLRGPHGSLKGAPGHVHFMPVGKTGSLKYKPVHFSTTVQKPIEKVYQRPHSVHGSITYRPKYSQGQPIQTLSLYQPVKGMDINQNHINGSMPSKEPSDKQNNAPTVQSVEIHSF